MKHTLEVIGGTREVAVPLKGAGKLYGEVANEGKPVLPFGTAGPGRLVMPAALKNGDLVRFELGSALLAGKVLAITGEALVLEDGKPSPKAEGK